MVKLCKAFLRRHAALTATSRDKNVYMVWPSNKTGDWKVMFKASTYGGKIFGNKTNLSILL
jgi:hypothetical protein